MNQDIELERFYIYLSNEIDFYYSAIIIPIGIVLNLVTILIFARDKHKNKSNINLLYIGLSIYDIIALFNSILFVQLLPSIGIILTDYSEINCVVLNWWRKLMGQAPSWIQVILTFERLANVIYINRFKFFKSKLIVIGILLLVLIVLGICNLGQVWYVNVSVNGTNQTISGHKCTALSAASLATDIVNVLLRFLVPFLAMLVMNVVLSRNLIRSKRRTLSWRKSFRRERNYTITIIGFNCLFFVLNLPWAIWYVVSHINQADSSLDLAFFNLLNAVAYSIFYLNNMSSFILNICFNWRFRREFLFLTHLSTIHSSFVANHSSVRPKTAAAKN